MRHKFLSVIMASNVDQKKDKSDTKAKRAEIKDLIDNEEYVLRKRLPRKLPKRDCDVYVTRKTNFQQQLKRCQKILDNGNLVCIHGLGVAINRAIHLALELQAHSLTTVDLAVHTSTVELVDDLEPLTDDRDFETLSRNSSAVHIRVFRPEIQSTLNQIAEVEKELIGSRQ